MNMIFKVFKFEYFTYIKNKSFIITTSIILGVIVILLNVPHIAPLFSSDNTNNLEVAIVDSDDDISNITDIGEFFSAGIIDPSGDYPDEILSLYFPEYRWEQLDEMSNDDMIAAVKDSYQMILKIDALNYSIFEKAAEGIYNMSAPVEALVSDMIIKVNQSKQLNSHGLTAEESQSIVNLTAFGSYETVGKDTEKNYFIGYILLFILYMAIILYGQFVLNSVISEKTSKASELLITSVRPAYIMFGKVFGAGFAGLTQLGLILCTSSIFMYINQDAWLNFSPFIGAMFDLSAVTPYLLFLIVSFFLGFFTYAFLYAALGSTVSKMEDASSAATIPMMFFMAAFFIAVIALGSPETTLANVCSFVPLLSPMVMFTRVVASEVPFYQVCISVVINSVFLVFIGIFSSRVYKTYAMMYGQKPSLGKIFKYMVSDK
jgi:ABC-type Na+ efflux pump, permease component